MCEFEVRADCGVVVPLLGHELHCTTLCRHPCTSCISVGFNMGLRVHLQDCGQGQLQREGRIDIGP